MLHSSMVENVIIEFYLFDKSHISYRNLSITKMILLLFILIREEDKEYF